MILVLLPGAQGSLCLVRTVAKVADYSGCVQSDSGARQICHLRGRGWQARPGHQGVISAAIVSYLLIVLSTLMFLRCSQRLDRLTKGL